MAKLIIEDFQTDKYIVDTDGGLAIVDAVTGDREAIDLEEYKALKRLFRVSQTCFNLAARDYLPLPIIAWCEREEGGS